MSEERRAYWSKLMAEHEASGTTIQAFCKLHGVSDHSFYLWRRRLRSKEPAPFALLKTVPGGGAPIELYLPCGARLLIANDVNAATLRGVLDALRS